mmetsp:Transcript_6800/g.15055  ORF Transcript_6800/g.15055 Transcript_6800/m.15055 type:complete len:248 (-) Transcript_6800:709-1452(-)
MVLNSLLSSNQLGLLISCRALTNGQLRTPQVMQQCSLCMACPAASSSFTEEDVIQPPYWSCTWNASQQFRLVPQLCDLLEQPLVGVVEVNKVVLPPDEAASSILECDAAQGQLLLEHEGLTTVGGDDDLLVLRDSSQQGDAQHLLHILHAHHVVLLNHLWSHTVHKQLDVVDSISLQETSNTISIANGCDLGSGNNEGLLGGGNGIDEANVNACWAIQNDKLVAKLDDGVCDLLHMSAGHVVPLPVS